MSSKNNSDWQEHDQLALVKAEIEYLLAQPGSRVALLKGEWGSGKTTLISKVLEARRHSYISLYGVSSIDEIKSQFVLSWLTGGSKEPKDTLISNWYARSWQFTKSQVKRLGTWFSGSAPFISQWVRAWTAKKYSYALPIGFYALLETNEIETIVFDDIERCHKDVGINSFLGMVSQIAESSSIKILIVGNLDKISSRPESADDLNGFEKSVDQVLKLEPPSGWLADLAVKETSRPKDIFKAVQYFCEETQTKNIRLLKRACRLLERTIRVLEDSRLLKSSPLVDLATFYLVLTYAKHEVDFTLSWEEISKYLRISGFSEMIFEGGEEASRIYKIAHSLNLPDIPFYEELHRHIDSGVLDEEGLISRIRELITRNADIRSIESSDKWEEMWDLYADSLRSNDKEIVEAMQLFLEKDSDLMTAHDYEQLYSLATNVGVDVSAYRVNAYARSIRQAQNWELPDLIDTYEDDPELLQIVQALIDEHIGEADIDEVLERVSRSNSWNTLDEILIGSMTIEGLMEWMVKPGDRKMRWIKAAQKIDKSGNVNEAIKRIANETDLSRMRAEKMLGIRVDVKKEQEV